MGKLILPWFGGSATVWTTSVLFFQLVLLLGYLYAHLSVRYLRPRGQTILHAAVIAATLAVLPIIPAASWKPGPGDDPTLRILALLTVTVGAPFFLLCTTGPLLQAWYARTRGRSPYRLFALSNAGSVLGLISYPLLVEPALGTRLQARTWSLVYLAFAGLAAFVALGSASGARSGPSPPTRTPAAAPAPAPEPDGRAGWSTPLIWLALAASPSLLFLAVTNQLSQNVAPIPFLWVLPLTLYLISFILCFEGRGWYRRRLFLGLLPVALVAMATQLFPDPDQLRIGPLIAIFSVALFVCCMACHGELARLRPRSGPVTRFYLMLSLGGALGGVFVAVVAPLLFAGYFELAVGLVVCGLTVLAVLAREQLARPAEPGRGVKLGLGGAAVLLAGLAILVVGKVDRQERGSLLLARNFYGSLIVSEPRQHAHPPTLMLTNGTIDHGEQFRAPALRRRPLTYYGPDTGVGLAERWVARTRAPLRVGVIGLGAGTLAAYGRPGDRYTFYEINPLAVGVATHQFTYLGDSRARTSVVLGDARLSLERESARHYDLLVADAFTGDSIPLHLLTREAFSTYFRQLTPRGVLAVHVSNSYLNLVPVVTRVAAALGRSAVLVSTDGDPARAIQPADWMLITDAGTAARLAAFTEGQPVRPDRSVGLWTDDYTNLLAALA